MSPDLTPLQPRHPRLAASEFQRDLFLGFVRAKDLSDLILGQFGIAIASTVGNGAVILLVGLVLGMRAPSQIGQLIVVAIAVVVAASLTPWARTNECRQHQFMDAPSFDDASGR